ncbi:Reticulocyte-binding protein 2 homolog a [Durusdinium trenchii]|uniref:Reticulocyte-binding protein 2 homolog a n=1 Tax=Durusdinium trenchii TaxID=1381693 RepID=A0ABP0HC76_9DINO
MANLLADVPETELFAEEQLKPIGSETCPSVTTLPSPSRAAMKPERTAMACVADFTGEWEESLPAVDHTEDIFLQARMPGRFGLGESAPRPEDRQLLEGHFEGLVAPNLAPSERGRGPGVNWSQEHGERAERPQLERQVEAKEARLRAQEEELRQRQQRLQHSQMENWKLSKHMMDLGLKIKQGMSEMKLKEEKMQHHRLQLCEREQRLKDFEAEVNLQTKTLEEQRWAKEEDFLKNRKEFEDLKRQEEGCESKLEAIAKSQERLRKNSEDLEMKALKFDEEKRKLEHDNMICRTEIRRLQQKLNQVQQIIPVGHDGQGNRTLTCPPDRPPNISTLPTSPPPPPTAPAVPPPAGSPGRGQILDASWGGALSGAHSPGTHGLETTGTLERFAETAKHSVKIPRGTRQEFRAFLGEGLISPQFDEWNPVRWFHHDAHGLQKELYKNATASAVTAEQFSSLKNWIEGGPGGWVSPKLVVKDYLSEKGRYERRLETTMAVGKDEVLVKLPLSHVLSADFCQQDLTDQTIRQVVDAQKKSSEPVDIAPWTWITLYTLAHAKKDHSAGDLTPS